jgi:hypothetical protein
MRSNHNYTINTDFDEQQLLQVQDFMRKIWHSHSNLIFVVFRLVSVAHVI